MMIFWIELVCPLLLSSWHQLNKCTDLAFELLDYSAEIRSKQSAVEKFSKTFGEEKEEFVAKRVRTEKNEPLPIQASKRAEATEEYLKIKTDIFDLDIAHQKQVTARLKDLAVLEHALAKEARQDHLVDKLIRLFGTLLEGYQCKTDAPELKTFSPLHIAGWYGIRHLLDMKETHHGDLAEIVAHLHLSKEEDLYCK